MSRAPTPSPDEESLLNDRGLLLGDGLFETVLADHGRLVRFDEHRLRLERGCAVIGLPPPSPDRLRAAAEAALDKARLGDDRAAIRLTWTAGSGGRGLDRPEVLRPRLLAAAAPAPAPTGPLRLATVGIRRNDCSPASRLKTLAYLDNVLARREAHAAGADDAVMLNTRGDVACAAVANLFWISSDRLFTPALDCGVLDGTMRAAAMAAATSLGCAPAEVHARPKALTDAQAIFLTNSLIGVRAVTAFDGRAIGGHPLIARIADACARAG